jgi:segregation and condensation protein B
VEAVGLERDLVEDALLELMTDYAHRDSALEVIETPSGYSLQLRETYQDIVTHLIPAELNTGALRTLAAIALKSPILQTDLIELRGSSAYQHVQDLVEQGFVKKRRQQDGRSFWLEVTQKFYQYFEIDQLSEGFADLTH